jgi:hypothetical protein
MSRSLFAGWGADLDADDFACALAAAGAIHPTGDDAPSLRDLVFRPRPDEVAWYLDAPPSAEVDARALSDAWRALVRDAPQPFRLAVHEWPPELRSLPWLQAELSRPAVGASGVYGAWRSDERVGWTWPLQIAVLDDGRSALRAALTEDPSWPVRTFAEVVDAESAEPVDLLLVPMGLRQAVARILPSPVTASAVVLTEHQSDWGRDRTLLVTLLDEVEGGAVAFARTGDPRAWLDHVLEELAHDRGLDGALLGAARGLGEAPPFVVADDRLLDETRITRVRDRVVHTMRNAAVAANGDGSALQEISDSVAALEDFEHETGGALAVAEGARAARELLPPPTARYLQAQVLEESEGVRVPARALRPQSSYSIAVQVGPPDPDWLADPEQPFPEESLPPAAEHRLTVVLSEPDLLEEPLSDEIVLPASGASDVCWFSLRTREARPVEARIIVLHRGRVLQTAYLRADVTVDGVGEPPRVKAEALVHPAVDLAGRTRFDAAFVVNHNAAGTARTTVVTAEPVEVHETTEFRDALDYIEAYLEAAVESGADFALRSENTRALLVRLARQGAILHQELRDLRGGPALAEGKRVQILSLMPERVFPIEFAYARKRPAKDAELCPNAERALETGRCDDCPSLTGSTHVCPLGFWCLSKIIERHGHNPDAYPPGGAEFVLRTAQVGDRLKLGRFTSSLFAASKHADSAVADTTARVLEALKQATGVQAVPADTWKAWSEGVKGSPPLLVLLPHTLRDDEDDLMEIGEIDGPERLAFGDIEDTYVGGAEPLVLLLGCSTAEKTLPFQRFTTAFRRGGAPVVVGTLTTVLGRHAGDVAAKLVAELSRTPRTTLGEVMRDLRRRLLLAGVPMVLVLVAFGDADRIVDPQGG